jgi:hypothetical protein
MRTTPDPTPITPLQDSQDLFNMRTTPDPTPITPLQDSQDLFNMTTDFYQDSVLTGLSECQLDDMYKTTEQYLIENGTKPEAKFCVRCSLSDLILHSRGAIEF